jgi:hypothetical protein
MLPKLAMVRWLGPLEEERRWGRRALQTLRVPKTFVVKIARSSSGLDGEVSILFGEIWSNFGVHRVLTCFPLQLR